MKTKANIANVLCIFFFLAMIVVIFIYPSLSTLCLALALICGMQAAKWKGQIALENDKIKTSIVLASSKDKKRVFMTIIFAIGISSICIAMAIWYLSPAFQNNLLIFFFTCFD